VKLRGYIPIAGPARREAADGTESPVRPVLGFEPHWFHLRCGVDFTERWHADPDYRAETLKRMLAELRRAFPGAVQWHGPDERHTWTIGGCYGVGVIPRLFGMGMQYHPDRWPVLVPGPPIEAIPEASQLVDSPLAVDILEQVEMMAARGIPVTGDLNWQGVLNVAFHVRGQDIFLDMAERPEWAEAFFAAIAETIILLAQRVQQRQRESGFDIDYMCVSNCTVNMVSPRMYARMLRPHDERIAQAFGRFGVHTCNWDVTPYLDALALLPKVGYLDMGLDSDLRAARARFPEARLAVLYSPWKLQAGATDEVEADIARVARELAPCDVIAADITWDTADHRVNEFLELCRRASESYLEKQS
jgi:hypothetical protein